MQCIMSLYSYNIRLSDIAGYFEQLKTNDSNFDHVEVAYNIDNVRKKFQDITQSLSGETISIFYPGYTKDEDVY